MFMNTARNSIARRRKLLGHLNSLLMRPFFNSLSKCLEGIRPHKVIMDTELNKADMALPIALTSKQISGFLFARILHQNKLPRERKY